MFAFNGFRKVVIAGAAFPAVALATNALPASAAPRIATHTAHRSGFGYRNEVNTRQGNQQSRIEQGVRSGQMTPGEERNVERRDESINAQANADRAANGGRLTQAERDQLNTRQNRVSNSINYDKHNGNTDATAAARNDTSAGVEQGQAQGLHQAERPKGPESH